MECTKPMGGPGNMVYRSARASGAVTLVSDLAEMSGTGNKREAINPKSGKRSTAKLLTAGIRNGITGGGLGSGSRRDPRTICRTGDAFSGGIGSQRSRGYQQTGGSSRESRFDFGRLVKDVAVNSLIGGLAGAAFYGFDKAVGAVCDGIRGRGNRETELFLPDEYYQNVNKNIQNGYQNPSTREIYRRLGNTSHEVETSIAISDEFGRIKYRIDYSTHGND